MVKVTEWPNEGRASLRFHARPAPDGPPVAYTEYRVGKDEWRRGPTAEVWRRGASSTVAYRSVDESGAVEPLQTWRKDWVGLTTVEYPPGSGCWTATYDWWRRQGGERWWLDHPVCLIFRDAPADGRSADGRCHDVQPADTTAAFVSSPTWHHFGLAVERTLRRLGLRSRVYDWIRALDLASDGGLAVGVGAPPEPDSPTVCTRGLKGRLHPGNLQSSLHVRVYVPPVAGRVASLQQTDGRALQTGRAWRGARAEGGADLPAVWAFGTCHLDVNELMRWHGQRVSWGARVPPGVPSPEPQTELVKYGGNSEWAATLVADRWERRFGASCVARGALPLGEAQDWFQVAQRGTHRGRSWVVGKWWRSDGRATILTLPASAWRR